MTELDPYAQAAQLLRAASEHHADGDMESAAVLTQLGQAYATLACAGPTTDLHPAVVASDLERLRTAVQRYLNQLRVGHKGKDELDRMRVLVTE